MYILLEKINDCLYNSPYLSFEKHMANGSFKKIISYTVIFVAEFMTATY